jgi:hypothetical protein
MIITFDALIARAIMPALAIIEVRDTPEAMVLMLGIGGQESGFAVRRQANGGPATGFWQFERGGGVRGVLTHPTSERKARELCRQRGVPLDFASAWAALERDDVLAAGFARLLLLTDPLRLPALGDRDGAWAYYARNWRPGKPHPERWPGNYARAVAAVEKRGNGAPT